MVLKDQTRAVRPLKKLIIIFSYNKYRVKCIKRLKKRFVNRFLEKIPYNPFLVSGIDP